MPDAGEAEFNERVTRIAGAARVSNLKAAGVLGGLGYRGFTVRNQSGFAVNVASRRSDRSRASERDAADGGSRDKAVAACVGWSECAGGGTGACGAPGDDSSEQRADHPSESSFALSFLHGKGCYGAGRSLLGLV